MDAPYGKEAGDYWRSKMRLRDRMQAAGAHEYEEHEGGSHEAALERGPDTALPVSEPAMLMAVIAGTSKLSEAGTALQNTIKPGERISSV